jgi:Uma2 family endonuclease
MGTRVSRVFAAPFDVVLSDHDVVEPDLLVLLSDQSGILTDTRVRGAPALVAEILSPGTRRTDEGATGRLYDRARVREYWPVDPDGQVITVRRRSSEGLVTAVEFSTADGDALTSPLLPGFSLPLDEWLRRQV